MSISSCSTSSASTSSVLPESNNFLTVEEAFEWIQTKMPIEGQENFEERFQVNGVKLAVLLSKIYSDSDLSKSELENKKMMAIFFASSSSSSSIPSPRTHRIACHENNPLAVTYGRKLGHLLIKNHGGGCLVDSACVVERTPGGGTTVTGVHCLGTTGMGYCPEWKKIPTPEFDSSAAFKKTAPVTTSHAIKSTPTSSYRASTAPAYRGPSAEQIAEAKILAAQLNAQIARDKAAAERERAAAERERAAMARARAAPTVSVLVFDTIISDNAVYVGRDGVIQTGPSFSTSDPASAKRMEEKGFKRF